jgi:hypothetical protein
MDHFLTISFAFPTVIFTVILIFLAIYWFFIVLGLFDIEFLDIDLDLDYGGEAGTGSIGGVAGVLIALGLVGIPVTIILSFILLFAWLVVYMMSLYVLSHIEMTVWFWLAAAVTIVLALVLAIPLTIIITKPMHRFFKVSYATRANELLGEVCIVTTSEVTDQFGEVELSKQGDFYIFQVRILAKNTLQKGDEVILVEYDKEQHLYYIEPMF